MMPNRSALFIILLVNVQFVINCSFQCVLNNIVASKRISIDNNKVSNGKIKTTLSVADNSAHYHALNNILSLDYSVVPMEHTGSLLHWKTLTTVSVAAYLGTKINHDPRIVLQLFQFPINSLIDKSKKGLARFNEAKMRFCQRTSHVLFKTFKDSKHKKSVYEWNTCTLDHIELINNCFSMYRFICDDFSPDNFQEVPYVFPIYLNTVSTCDQVQLCWSDKSGLVRKKSFLTMDSARTVTSERNHFEVVERTNGLHSPLSLSLAPGDQVAFKARRSRLLYTGSDLPISGVTVFVAETGILPAVRMVTGMLDVDSTVVDVTLVWANQHPGDLLYDEEVRDLERRYPQRLRVVRVELQGGAAEATEQLRELVAPHEKGRVAMVLDDADSEGGLFTVVKEMLLQMRYPLTSILTWR